MQPRSEDDEPATVHRDWPHTHANTPPIPARSSIAARRIPAMPPKSGLAFRAAAVLVGLVQTGAVLLWDREECTLIAANLVGERLRNGWSAATKVCRGQNSPIPAAAQQLPVKYLDPSVRTT